MVLNNKDLQIIDFDTDDLLKLGPYGLEAVPEESPR